MLCAEMWLQKEAEAGAAPGAGAQALLTQEGVGDVLGHLVAGAAHLGEVRQLAVQHPLELEGGRNTNRNESFMNAFTRLQLYSKQTDKQEVKNKITERYETESEPFSFTEIPRSTSAATYFCSVRKNCNTNFLHRQTLFSLPEMRCLR